MDETQEDMFDFDPNEVEVAPAPKFQGEDDMFDFTPEEQGINGDTSGYVGGPPVDLSTAKEGPGGFSAQPTAPSVSTSGVPLDVDTTNIDPQAPVHVAPDPKVTAAYQDNPGGMVTQTPEKGASVRAAPVLNKNFKPTTDMYKNTDDPWAKFNYLAGQAKEHTMMGDPIINGVRVPRPTEYGSGMDLGIADEGPITAIPGSPTVGGVVRGVTNITDNIGSGLGRDMVKNVMVNGAALLDELNKSIGGPDAKYAERFEHYMADAPKTSSEGEHMLREGVQIGAGLIAGQKLGLKAASGKWNMTDNVSKLATYISGLGSVIGSVATTAPDSQAVINGKRALYPYLNGVPIEEDGTFSRQVIIDKINNGLEEFILAKPVEWAATAGEFGYRFTKGIVDDITGHFNLDKMAMDVATDWVKKAKPDANADDVQQIIDAIKTNSEVEMIDPTGKLPDFNLSRTTSSAAAEGFEDPVQKARFMELQKGAMDKNTPLLKEKVGGMYDDVNTFQEGAVEAHGGVDAMEQSRSTVAEQGKKEIGLQADHQRHLEEQLAAADEQLTTNLRTNPLWGDNIRKLQKEAGVDIISASKDEKKGIVTRMVEAAKKIMNTKDELYDAIPEGVAVDMDSIIPLFKEAEAAGALEPRVLRQILDENTAPDYKWLHNDILPMINQKIGQIINSPKPDFIQLEALRNLSHNISETQLNRIIERADAGEAIDPAIVAAVDKARSYYKNSYLPFQQEGTPTQRIFDTMWEVEKGRWKTVADRQQYRIQNLNPSVLKDVGDEKPGSTQSLIDLMDTPEYQGNSAELADMVAHEAGTKLVRLMADGDPQKIDVGAMTEEVSKTVAMMRNSDQEIFRQKGAELEKFVNDLKSGKISKEQAQKTLEEQLPAIQAKKKAIYESALGRFIHEDSEGVVKEKTNAFKVFEELFTKDGNEAHVNDILQAIEDSGDPMAKEGLQAAWLEAAKNSVSDSSSKFNPRNLADTINSKTSDFMKYGEQIFDNPEELGMYKGVLNLINDEHSKLTEKSIAPIRETLPGEKASQAMDLTVTYTLGVLNALSSRVRRTGTRILKETDPKQQMLQILDKFHTDPEEAIKQLNLVKEALKKESPEQTRKYLFRFGVYAGLYAPSDEQKFEKDWEYEQNVKPYEEMGRSKMQSVPKGEMKTPFDRPSSSDISPEIDPMTTDSIKAPEVDWREKEAQENLKALGGNQEEDGSFKGSILPFSKDKEGNVKFDINAGLTGSAISGATLPGDMLSGKVKPGSKEELDRAMDLGGFIPGGAAFAKPSKDTLLTFIAGTKKDHYQYLEEVRAGLSEEEIFRRTGLFKDIDEEPGSRQYIKREIPDSIRKEFVDVTDPAELNNATESHIRPDGSVFLVTKMKNLMSNTLLASRFADVVKEHMEDGKLPDFDNRGLTGYDFMKMMEDIPVFFSDKMNPNNYGLAHFRKKGEANLGAISMNMKFVNGEYVQELVNRGWSPQAAKKAINSQFFSTLLHEQQHKIQEVLNHYKMGTDEENYIPPEASYDMYRNQAAEKEPRNVQKRMDRLDAFTTHPWRTLDKDEWTATDGSVVTDANEVHSKMAEHMGYNPRQFYRAMQRLGLNFEETNPLDVANMSVFKRALQEVEQEDMVPLMPK